MKGLVKDFLPAPVRIQGVSFFFKNLALDFADAVAGRADPELPPRHLNISGNGPFRAIGESNLKLCQTLGGLQKEDEVLDLGCGIGRTAVAMKGFLQSPGRYVGMDIMEFAIRWCQQHVRSEKAEFRFVHADVVNRMYNPRGRLRAEEFQFPVVSEDASFVLATSLFTHLPPGTVAHYVAECSRVLRAGGVLLATWFLLDLQTLPAVRAKRGAIHFPYEFEDHAQASETVPEEAVAYRREYVESLFASHGFALEALRYGRWSGVDTTVDSFQDVTVARRLT